MKAPHSVLMVSPDYYDIVDEKNIHMSGQSDKVNLEIAKKQWHDLHDIYLQLTIEKVLNRVNVIEGIPGCEDMVFAANQSIPFIDSSGNRKVIISRMKHSSRQREIPAFEAYYSSCGYELIYPPQGIVVEGMGDLLSVPDTDIWLAGYGQRTQYEALEWLKDILPGEMIPIALNNPYFYHLDTCMIPVNKHTLLYCREAFDISGINRISQIFEHLVAIPIEEARDGFALNAHLVVGENRNVAVIQKGNDQTISAMKDLNIDVIQTDTSEFMRSGGSVFCMKMMVYE